MYKANKILNAVSFSPTFNRYQHSAILIASVYFSPRSILTLLSLFYNRSLFFLKEKSTSLKCTNLSSLPPSNIFLLSASACDELAADMSFSWCALVLYHLCSMDCLVRINLRKILNRFNTKYLSKERFWSLDPWFQHQCCKDRKVGDCRVCSIHLEIVGYS